MNAFSFWMDEPRLHHPNLYLPSLPAEYEPELLGGVIHTHSYPWLHFVDIPVVFAQMRVQAEHWLPFEIRTFTPHVFNLSSPTRIKDCPVGPPGSNFSSPPFTPVDVGSLVDLSRALPALRPELSLIQESAKVYCAGVSHHVGLDMNFLEFLVDVNYNTEKETVTYTSCHKGNCYSGAFPRVNQCVKRAFTNKENDVS